MNKIKILDCTLRDGGYVNDWDFGFQKSKIIVDLLNKAKIDYIELGFLTNDQKTSAKTLFNSFDEIKSYIPQNVNKEKLFAMIKFGKFDIKKVPNKINSPIEGIRFIFKKKYLSSALECCKALKDKGYKLFINPTYVNQYSNSEIIELINEVNKISPYGFSIVDSMGVLREEALLSLYNIIDNNLRKETAICFHSHNNLQLSFLNAQCLMKICSKRELIIDSTVFVMGRVAGNLRSELLVKYINDNYNGKLDIVPVLKIAGEGINPIFLDNAFGQDVS